MDFLSRPLSSELRQLFEDPEPTPDLPSDQSTLMDHLDDLRLDMAIALDRVDTIIKLAACTTDSSKI